MKTLQLFFLIPLLAAAFLMCNFLYQVIKKPSELWTLFALGASKHISETWKAYEHLFKAHSTAIMTPEFLCALAQVESSGNPFITPKWRLDWTGGITHIYAPLSSAVGLMQYTDGTFEEAKTFCVRRHKVVKTGPWYELESCWFNAFYNRISPSHSIEMTSARLHYHVEKIIRQNAKSDISLWNKQKLAAVIHLCGLENGKKVAEHDFNLRAVSSCGDHSPLFYCSRIQTIMNRLKSLNKK
jgi:hypothetical protein